VVPAAKVCPAETMTTAVTATVVTATMAPAMSAAVAAAASADRHARQQGAQNNHRNSDCRFEHDTLPAAIPLPFCST
jgi:hypothetical protein